MDTNDNNSTNKNKWVKMEDTDGDGIYGVNKPDDGNSYPQVIFVRMNPASTTKLDWSNKWDQTKDLTVPTNSNNMFTIAAGAWNNASGTWSVHKPEVKEAWTEEVVETSQYWIGNGGESVSNWVTRWSNNGGDGNIKVSNLNTTYDIYFHKGDDKDWGFEVHYIVLEHGSKTPTLK